MRTAASIKLINTRRPSTDPIWGIPDGHRACGNLYVPQPQTSLGTAASGAGNPIDAEKQMGYSVWKTQRMETPEGERAYRVDSPPAYHASRYTGVSMHGDAGEQY